MEPFDMQDYYLREFDDPRLFLLVPLVFAFVASVVFERGFPLLREDFCVVDRMNETLHLVLRFVTAALAYSLVLDDDLKRILKLLLELPPGPVLSNQIDLFAHRFKELI